MAPSTPTFTFSRRMGNTQFQVNVYCAQDTSKTYEDRLLELIRSKALNEETDLSEEATSRYPSDGASVA